MADIAYPPDLWQVRDPESLLWARYDGEYVLYHRLSGMTHLLNDGAYLLLTEILVEPVNFEEICQVFEQHNPDTSSSEINNVLAELLGRLEYFGLISRCTPADE